MNFSRTHSSADMAFPKSCEYACPVERVKPANRWGFALVLIFLLVGGLYALA